MKFIETPNLPQSKVTQCIVSGEYQSVIKDLENLSIEAIIVPPCSDIDEKIACHADMLCHHLGGKNLILYPYDNDLSNKLSLLGLEVSHTNSKLSKTYPNDILFNSSRVGKWLICKEKYTEKAITSSVGQCNIINTKQGYAKCSTLVVDEKSIITSDSNISSKAMQNGLNVLLISNGNIVLEGYDYGFIGGCAFKPDKNKIYFTGNLKNHKDYKIIKKFLLDRSIDIICGSSERLIDIGSIIPIKCF